jgi:hypothetical protein
MGPRVIPLARGKTLYRSADQSRAFVEIPGAGHNNHWLTKQYLPRMLSLCTKHGSISVAPREETPSRSWYRGMIAITDVGKPRFSPFPRPQQTA